MPPACLALTRNVQPLQGLGIDKWVWDAWSWSSDGSGLGLSVPESGSTVPPTRGASCWWAPPGSTCRQFYNATHVPASAAALRVPLAGAGQEQGRKRQAASQPTNASSADVGAAPAGSSAVQRTQAPDAAPGMVAVPMQRAPAGRAPAPRVSKKRDAHDTGSKALWRAMYADNDPAIAEMVYELYRPDFEAFGFEKEDFTSDDEP